MKEVAGLARVDASVVSRIINNDPRLSVSPATRQRVLDAIDKLEYRPNLAARALRTSRGRMLALVLPQLTNPVYARIVSGAHRCAVERGYAVVLSESDDAAQKLLDRNISRGIDGVLLAAGTLDDAMIRKIGDSGVPVVVVNRDVEGMRWCVTVDDTAGTVLAVEHLIALCHEKIGVVSGSATMDTTVRRLASLTSAEPGGPLVTAADLVPDSGLAAGRRLIQEHPEVTAIFATTLMLGVGVLRAAREAGRAVPDDLSVIALHDAEIARFTAPTLTTVALPMEELGKSAAGLLIDVVEGAEREAFRVTTPPLLIERESTAPLRSPSR